MKMLAYVLLIVGIASGIATFYIWKMQKQVIRESTKTAQQANEDLATLRFIHQMDERGVRTEISTDELAIEQYNAEITLAHLDGISDSKARHLRELSEEKLAADKTRKETMTDLDFLGPDSHEKAAMNRAGAAKSRFEAAQEWLARTERFAYIVLGLFVADGFAFALSRRSIATVK